MKLGSLCVSIKFGEFIMKDSLADIDFSIGAPEAWEPRERNSLSSNFLPIEPFFRVSEPDKVFLCGRRGSGKSAIALMLEVSSSCEYKEAIQGEIEEYGAYMDIVRILSGKRDEGIDIDIRNAIRRLWLWVLPVKAMQTVLEETGKRGQSFDNDLKAMQAYFTSLPEPLHQNSRIGDLLSNIFNHALSILGNDGVAMFNTYLVNLTGSQEFLVALAALSETTKSKQVLLVFDTLESYRVFQPYMVESLRGILEAIIAFLADRRMEGIFLKFFIPAEVYSEIFAGFPGKVQSRAVFLTWRIMDLISMLSRRFLRILIRTEAISEKDIGKLTDLVDKAYESKDDRYLREEFWYKTGFLPRNITNRLSASEDCFAYMFRHTQRRPRDVITQMQSIINEARFREEFPYISQDRVISGVHNDMSLLQIIADALIPYEGCLSGSLIASARSIFYQRPIIMNGRELKRFAHELYNIYPLEHIGPEIFLNLLLDCGVVGTVVEDKKSLDRKELYCKANFEYLIQGEIPLADRFLYCMHPAMGNIFHMSPVEGYGVIYPMPEGDLWLENTVGITRS